jgi:hypothetical protein
VSVSITLNFPDVAAAAAAMTRLAAYPATAGDTYLPVTAPAIKYEDRPDVGVESLATRAAEFVKPALEFNPFAAGVTGPSVAVAPPMEVAAAPVPPTVTPATTTPPERDSAGLPWDARIHGSTKTTNADGTWRQKRGLNDPALKARVEAELRAAVSAGSPQAGSVASAAPPPAAPVAPPPAPPAAASAPTPPAPVAPPAPVSTPPATPPTAENFGQFMARMGPVFAADPVRNTALMGQALATVGLTSVAQLAPRPDLIKSVSDTFDALAAVPA